MALIELPLPTELANELQESFYQGPMLNERGQRRLDEEQVARINALTVVIQAEEHPPPHFHVRFAGQNASFSIANGRRLPNVKGLEKYDHNIWAWWKTNLCTLIGVWNRTRPADCPVGAINVPPECLPPK